MTAEIVVMWAAVTSYALAAVLEAIGLVFKKDRALRAAVWLSAAGLAVHAGGIATRWSRVGHGPYLGFYEVISSFAWIAVLVFLLIVWRYPRMRPMGVVVMPIAFLALAAAMLSPMSELTITARLASYWLVIHVWLAKLSYGSFLGAFVLGVAQLLRDRATARPDAGWIAKLPEAEVLDDLTFRLVSVGFIFLTMMIAAGAIWANEAWGRYWGWDPIETWSLISWVVYAGYLHTRLTLGWRGRRAAWYAISALPILLFALVGVPLVYKSIHAAYLTGIGG